jgi:predicted PurR-regulated permease PerM
MNLRSQPYIIRLAAILITVFLTVMALLYLKIILVPLLFAIIFAVMIFPFCLRLEKWGVSKALAAFTTVFVSTMVLAILIYFVFVQLSIFIDHIPQISARLNSLITELRDFAAHKLSMKRSEVGNKFQEQIAILQNSSFSASSLGTLSSLLINVFLIPLYIFFLIYYRHFFIEFFYKLFYGSDKRLIDETFQKMGIVIKGYLLGQLLDILIIGSANAAFLYFVGVSYPIVLGFGIAILCIIPYLGMIVGSLIAVLVTLMTTHTSWQPITVFVVLWVIHIIDSNVVSPLVIGSRVSLNPLIAIFVLFLFGELWGLAGLFLALPLTAILKVIFDTVPDLKAYGFLLGEPEKHHLKNQYLHIRRLHRLIEIRRKQIENPVVTDISVEPIKEK